MPIERIGDFVRRPREGSFEELALAAFAFQWERVEPIRRLCERRGIEPGSVGRWREIPAVPTLAFKRLTLAAAPAAIVFRSPGAAAGASLHHHPYPDLLDRIVDASFPPACLDRLDRPPMLSLVPPAAGAPESSLAYLADRVLRRFGAPDSRSATGPRGVDPRAARSFLAARQRDRRPTLVLAPTPALAALLGALERQGLRFRLPPGSRLVEAGESAGPGPPHRELLAALERTLGLAAGDRIRQYGAAELTSRCYAGGPAAVDPDLFRPPHWTRVRILRPATLAEAPPGETGLIAILDLGNVGSALHLVTDDLGVAEAGGFRLLGRASAADLEASRRVVAEMTGERDG